MVSITEIETKDEQSDSGSICHEMILLDEIVSMHRVAFNACMHTKNISIFTQYHQAYLTVLIGTTEKEDLSSTEAHEPSDDIACDAGVSVADVRLVVDVVDGRGNLEGTLAIVKGRGGRSRDSGEESRRGCSDSVGLSSVDQRKCGSVAATFALKEALATCSLHRSLLSWQSKTRSCADGRECTSNTRSCDEHHQRCHRDLHS